MASLFVTDVSGARGGPNRQMNLIAKINLPLWHTSKTDFNKTAHAPRLTQAPSAHSGVPHMRMARGNQGPGNPVSGLLYAAKGPLLTFVFVTLEFGHFGDRIPSSKKATSTRACCCGLLRSVTFEL